MVEYLLPATIVFVCVALLVSWCAQRRNVACELVVSDNIHAVFEMWDLRICIFSMEAPMSCAIERLASNDLKAVAWMRVLRFRSQCMALGIEPSIDLNYVEAALDGLLLGKKAISWHDSGILLRRTIDAKENCEEYVPMKLCISTGGNAFVDTKLGRVICTEDAISLFAKPNHSAPKTAAS